MMKILLISASPRKERSQTFLLAKELLRGLKGKNTAYTIIHLCDLKIGFCRHCESCHKKILSCPIKDDVSFVLKKMLDARGIIIATPNYIDQVTGAMKTLFDRSSHFIHCKRLEDKYVAAVVSSGSGCNKKVLEYIEYYAHTCAAQYSGGVSARAPVSRENMEEAFILGKKLRLDIRKNREFPRQIRIIEKGRAHFRKIIEARKNEWTEEYRYWQEKMIRSGL